MSRSLAYRRSPTPSFEEALRQAQTERLCVVQNIGPACFVVRNLDDSTSKYRIKISNTHTCTCGNVKRESVAEYCQHVLEVEEILSVRRGAYASSSSTKGRVDMTAKVDNTAVKGDSVERREVDGESDLCPICHDLLGSDLDFLTYCSASCGANVHTTTSVVQRGKYPARFVGYTGHQEPGQTFTANGLGCRSPSCLLSSALDDCFEAHARDTDHPMVALNNPRKFIPIPASAGAPHSFRNLVTKAISTISKSVDERFSVCAWPCGHTFTLETIQIRWSTPCPVCGMSGLPGLAKALEYYGKAVAGEKPREADVLDMSVCSSTMSLKSPAGEASKKLALSEGHAPSLNASKPLRAKNVRRRSLTGKVRHGHRSSHEAATVGTLSHGSLSVSGSSMQINGV
ncbi:zinc finger SWIM-type containing 2 [Perkinsus chesapeaki]|uniref:Zinc finger SWIM-type containing 2 n=1 Tax=Perkinsus chesapeaki TaxID=330153 RepID=A0A7J6N022_PERCH|nr:zinc finger SWIM-type containing 2 [Perkinsus chesapeaki]